MVKIKNDIHISGDIKSTGSIEDGQGNVLEDKQNKLTAGANITITPEGVISASGGGGSSDYTELENKPTINNVELNGNKTSGDLGLQPALPSGTAGQFLLSQGSGNQPAFMDPPFFMICSTAGSTATKTVSLTNFKLTTGARVCVKMAHAHTTPSYAVLKVGTTSGHDMHWADGSNGGNGAPIVKSNTWDDNDILDCIYNGTFWVCSKFKIQTATAPVWGTVTGDIENQTDLIDLLPTVTEVGY